MGLKTASASSKSKKGVTFSAALRQTPQADARTVDLAGHQPPIDTLDAALKDLKSLRNLSLSTNTISNRTSSPSCSSRVDTAIHHDLGRIFIPSVPDVAYDT